MVIFEESELNKKKAQSHLLQWGGMPALLKTPEEKRFKWIKDYEYTYVERDITDLARLSDLQPFQRLQKIAALRSANLLNFSEVARDIGMSVDTVRRYIEYLKLSYEAFTLQPYYMNSTTSLIKTLKLYWYDIGLLRYLTGNHHGMTGEIFETFVISEIVKWIKTSQRFTEPYFYRTHSGSEIDLLLKTEFGVIGIEIKYRNTVVAKDIKPMLTLSKTLENWLGGIVIYNGDSIERIPNTSIWKIPAWRLLT